MASLKDRMLANSKLKAKTLSNTTVHVHGEGIPTDIPALNLALRGSMRKGISKGLTQITGESGTFKTLFALTMAKSFLEHHKAKGEEAMILLYSNEHGATEQYFEDRGIGGEDLIYTSFNDIDEFGNDIVNQLKGFTEKDNVFIIVDSVGLAATTKEIKDAESGSSKADMTRAKKLKSIFRIITPHLSTKGIPMFAINHIYFDQSVTYKKAIIGGGQGIYLASNEVWVIYATQLKNSKEEKIGNYFTINIDKSRFVKKFSKIPIAIRFDEGVDKFSGLLEWAVESGHVEKVKTRYTRPGVKGDKTYWEKDTHTEEFWAPILADDTFHEYVENKFTLGGSGKNPEAETGSDDDLLQDILTDAEQD